MKIFTIENGKVKEGVTVDTFHGAGFEIPAILVGEKGRGRRLGVMPVSKDMGGYILRADIGRTRSGRPKLIPEKKDTNEEVLCVFRTMIGFRGGNKHTGDFQEEWWELKYSFQIPAKKAGVPIKERYTQEEVKKYSPMITSECFPRIDPNGWPWDYGFEYRCRFKPFPGKILVSGIIAQGIAGRMGSGEQLIAIIPKGKVFRTAYTGRLYGKPSEHYYLWDGKKLHGGLTWEERKILGEW